MHTVHLNIGSNSGHSISFLENAVAALSRLSEMPVRVSPVYESEAWGFSSDNRFLNIGVEIATSLTPTSIIERVLEIQNGICSEPHRDENGAYIDRKIDIDIIYIDDLVISSPQLTVPHPRMHLRRFVLQPLNHLAPDWKHPILGKNAAEMLSALEE